MKSNTLKLLFATSIVAMMVFACSKKEEEKKPITKADLLTAKPWKLLSATVTPGILLNGKKTTDLLTTNLYECSLDDMLKFNADGTGLYDQGKYFCYNLPASSKIKWNFNIKEDVLSVSIDTGNQYELFDEFDEFEIENNKFSRVFYKQLDSTSTQEYEIKEVYSNL
ncbi:MAG: hypothetical protein KA327_10550 [Pseudarcicella sp.]|nr:hypothetical protein [Pseudarcicella sp.]